MAGEVQEPTSSSGFYPRLQRFLRPTDLLVSDTGTCLLKLNALRLPPGVAMESQTLWSSIGWGTPATLGCALAEQDRRVVLVTGDGGHQLTAQEIGVMGFTGISPVVMLTTTFLSGVMQTSKKHWAVGVGGAARLPHWQSLIRHSPLLTIIQVLLTSRS